MVIPPEFKDNRGASLEDRIVLLLQAIVQARTGSRPEVEEVKRYHSSGYGDKKRLKHFVATPDAFYSIKSGLNLETGEFTRADINLEIPRDRADLAAEHVVGKQGKEFVTFKLGDMKLPAILVEKDDEMAADEMVELATDLVSTGQARRLAFAAELPYVDVDEIKPATFFLLIRRFERRLRDFLVQRFKEVYGNDWENRLLKTVGADLEQVRSRIVSSARKYGQLPEEITTQDIVEHLGFEHYRRVLENRGVWDKAFIEYFPSREMALAGLEKIQDARNELAHNRATIHPQLWQSCRLEMELLQSHMAMNDVVLKRLVALVKG